VGKNWIISGAANSRAYAPRGMSDMIYTARGKRKKKEKTEEKVADARDKNWRYYGRSRGETG
jgi:hypothetical protein